MITNAVLVPSVVQSLFDSEMNFYLTGSRFFGGVHINSDWDFLTEDSPETRAWLFANGFEEDKAHDDYNDPSIVTVLYAYCQHEGRRVKVDVQLVKDVDKKLFVQNALKKHWKHGLPSDKETKRVIWNAAYAVVKHVG